MWIVVCKVAGAALIILGAHGLYVYANPFQMGADLGKLFMTLDLQIAEISKVIRWMSVSATYSWIMPAAFLVMGYFLMKSGRDHNVNRATRA